MTRTSRRYDRNSLLKKHPRWLDQLGHRCQCTGKIVGKHHKGKYRRYNFHHTHSNTYGGEVPGWNYLLLCPLAHWFVHNVLGGAWFSDRDITAQNARAQKLPLTWLWEYPNIPQRLFHFWCRLPSMVKLALLAYVVGMAVKYFLSLS